MTERHQDKAGRGPSRPALFAGLVALLVGGVLLAARAGEPTRGPIAVPNPEVAAPVESTVAGVRFVSLVAAPEILVPDTRFPTRSARLLFFAGRPTQRLPNGEVLTLDGAGGILTISPELHARRVRVDVEGRQITSVTGAPDDGLWLVTGDGEVLLLDRKGQIISTVPGPFDYSEVASDAAGVAWLVRSREHIAFRPVFGSTPLLTRLDPEGEPDGTVGTGVVPKDFLLTHLASSGRIVATESVIYYAPFIRDEVVALSAAGDTLWVSSRGLPQSTSDPRFEVHDGAPVIDYAPVNIGIALGPDGRLYVLSVPGFTTSEGRLDVVDRETGDLLRTAILPVPLPTLAADADGRVYLLDGFELLTGVPARDREAFQGFNLERLDGGHMTLDSLEGKVTLINFWASWCAPCRVEMPELDRLQKSIDDDDFLFITMNEDVFEADAAAFLADYNFDFPVLKGGGKLRATYHYIGLPFTVVLDRQRRVVQRFIGYAGDSQIQSIRAVIMAELNREGDGGGGDHGDGHGHARH